MAGSFKGLTQKQINQKIKKGHGSGQGNEYQPFIRTHEVSSRGRSHRVFGQKAQRIHHFLSDLELAVFLILEWSPNIVDIREQFPLRTEDTTRITKELGIIHRTYSGTAQVLTSDFLVDFKDRQLALQAKPSGDLTQPQTIERLAIEQAYWQEKDIPWAIVTEREIPTEAFKNIQWLYGAQHEDLPAERLHHYRELFNQEFERKPNAPIIEVAQGLDLAYRLTAGESLYWLRNLLARRYFLFDIGRPYRDLTPRQLQLNDADIVAGGYERVSG